MPPKRKAKGAATSARTQPRLVEQPQSMIVIDRDGDLFLTVKQSDSTEHEKPTIFRVSRKILSMSSPVFKAMLSPDSPFLEGQSNTYLGLPKVDVEDENIKAIEIILYAIHLQGHLVPENVSYTLLHYLALICDKYDLRRSLGSWPETWVKTHPTRVVAQRNKSLFIAIAFKLDNFYAEITKSLIFSCSALDDGTMVMTDGKVIGEHVPQVITDELKLARTDAIKDIEAELWWAQDVMQRYDAACDYYESVRREHDVEFCKLFQLGIMKLRFPYLEHPHDQSSFRKQSLDKIKSDLDGLKHSDMERLQAHNCFKSSKIYEHVNKRLGNIEGLKFNESWNLQHGKISMSTPHH